MTTPTLLSDLMAGTQLCPAHGFLHISAEVSTCPSTLTPSSTNLLNSLASFSPASWVVPPNHQSHKSEHFTGLLFPLQHNSNQWAFTGNVFLKSMDLFLSVRLITIFHRADHKLLVVKAPEILPLSPLPPPNSQAAESSPAG